MRITQEASVQNLLRQINLQRDRIGLLQRNLATGKRINTVSDDPGRIESVLRFRNLLTLNNRFQENINNATEFLNFASNALDDSADILSTIKELAIQGVDSTGTDEFEAIGHQITELLEELVDLANSRFGNRYIFGGVNVSTQPFVLATDYSGVTANPDGIDGELQVELGQGNIDSYNITGEEAFLGTTDVFQTIIDLRDAFFNEDSTTINNLLTDVDASLDQLLQTNTRAGAKANRFAIVVQQLQRENLQIETLLSEIENTNMPETITELQAEGLALEGALRTLAEAQSVSLMDFI